MSPVKILACLSLSLLGACSTIPRQEDVTGEQTPAIVQKIRCEARQALDAITVELLRNPALGANAATWDIADQIERGVTRGVDLQSPHLFNQLSKAQQEIFIAYTLSAVTFDFRFNIDEQNNNGAGAALALPLTRGAFAAGLSTNANFQRVTERKFQVVNTFHALHKLPREECEAVVARAENIIYPITGKIGIDKVFRDFVNIDLQQEVYASDTRFSDRLEFTTTYSAGTTPGLTLNPVSATALSLTSLTADLNARRSDLHQVTLNIAKGKKASRLTLPALDAARLSAAGRSLQNANFTRIEDLFIFSPDQFRRFLR